MMRKHVANFLLASSMALGIGPLAANEASAQPLPGGMGPGEHGEHGPMMMMHGPMMRLRELGLTEAQQDQIFKIHHDQMPAMHEQMKQVHRSREELTKLALADRFDEGRARQLADAHGKAIAALAVMRAQTMSRVREILTPEQRSRMDQFMQRRMQTNTR